MFILHLYNNRRRRIISILQLFSLTCNISLCISFILHNRRMPPHTSKSLTFIFNSVFLWGVVVLFFCFFYLYNPIKSIWSKHTFVNVHAVI